MPGTGLSQANAVARRLCAALCQWQGQCSSFGARPARLLSAQPMAKLLIANRGGAGARPPPLKAPHWLRLWPVHSSFAVRAPCAHQRKENASHMAKRFQKRRGEGSGRERIARSPSLFPVCADRWGNGRLARCGRARSPSGPRLAVASARRPYQTAATSAASPAKGFPMARPQSHQGLNVSCLNRSQCLAVSMSPQVSGLRSLVSPTLSLGARLARHGRGGNRRADMRHETRDLAGGHET